jgi:hypothetical protein
MQQGLAFYQRLLLLKVLKIFNFSVFHLRTVFYAPHHSHTSKQWNKISNHQTVLNVTKQGHKIVLRFDTITWISRMLKTELKRVL